MVLQDNALNMKQWLKYNHKYRKEIPTLSELLVLGQNERRSRGYSVSWGSSSLIVKREKYSVCNADLNKIMIIIERNFMSKWVSKLRKDYRGIHMRLLKLLIAWVARWTIISSKQICISSIYLLIWVMQAKLILEAEHNNLHLLLFYFFSFQLNFPMIQHGSSACVFSIRHRQWNI